MNITIVVNFPFDTAKPLTEKARALNLSPAQFIAQIVALDVCEPEDKDEQMRAGREANKA